MKQASRLPFSAVKEIVGGASVKLRRYRRGDLDSLFMLDQVCFGEPFRFSRTTIRRFSEAPNAHTVVIEEDDRVIGFSIVHVEVVQSQQVAYVVTLDVDPTFHRRGIARALMADSEKHATSESCGAMLLHVFVENDVAVKFYECEGFQRLGVAENFYGSGLHAFLYRKSLP